MSSGFPCPECGAERTIDAQGAADSCPSCGAPAIDNVFAEESEHGADAIDLGQAGLEPVESYADVHDLIGDQEADDEDAFAVPTKGAREEGDMDMTPMVDVTFLLLIFFMITAAFSLQKSIEIPKPEETEEASTQVRDPEEDQTEVITIIIDQFNTFRIQTASSEEEAPSKHDLLRKMRKARDEAPPDQMPSKLLVKAHGDATHERVVMALDAGVEVGMEEVQLMTVEEDL